MVDKVNRHHCTLIGGDKTQCDVLQGFPSLASSPSLIPVWSVVPWWLQPDSVDPHTGNLLLPMRSLPALVFSPAITQARHEYHSSRECPMDEVCTRSGMRGVSMRNRIHLVCMGWNIIGSGPRF